MKIIEKSLDEKKVKQISLYKKEPSWMTEFRLKSYQKFIETKNPNFGPPLSINFDLFTYYKKVTDDVKNNWNDVKKDIQETFCQIGLIESEKKYLDGVGAQFESEVVYHNMIQELTDKNVIFYNTEKDTFIL